VVHKQVDQLLRVSEWERAPVGKVATKRDRDQGPGRQKDHCASRNTRRDMRHKGEHLPSLQVSIKGGTKGARST
jgi:hypothetical protein